MPRYDIEVELIGQDGNAYAIIANVRRAIRKQVGPEEAAVFSWDALEAESYDELLRLVMNTVEVV